jgi:N-acetylglutamate synthase-like GNAT family acetyltransferase
MSISFSHITTNDEGRIDDKFEEFVVEANKVWSVAFNNEGYGRYECPATRVAIGSIDGNPVCACAIEYWWKNNTTVLIHAVGASPQNRGYGTSLMRHIVEHLEDLGIQQMYLKVDKNDKADRLEKFYSQYGFVKVDKVDEDDEVFVDCDTDEEYVMSRSGSVNSV